jgi:Alpha/beta hydrolase domain
MRQSSKRIIGALVLALVAAACISGPISGPVSLGTGFDVSLVGYARSEFFMTNKANSYSPVAPLTADGQWNVVPDPTQATYKTRLVVYRPTDPARFNGTVVVEWLNVTAGVDLANDWVMAHNELVRSGAVWVGVSAQAVGVNALRTNAPDRYGSLVHPGDSYSYDMFTHAGQRILDTPAVLGGLTTERLIATGESQSASRLVSYINGIHPRHKVYDGFLVHSRSAGASSLRQAPLSAVPSPSPVAIRNDIDVPVMVVQAEGDVIGSNLGARQPDTPLFRSWEMAGTSHADSYTASAGFTDIGDGSGAANMFAFMRVPQNAGCANPINAGAHHWILQAAFNRLDVWISSGVPPASAPLLDVESTSPTVLARDEFGNALGGIRSPHVDAPIATLTGINTGGGFCRLFGTTIPFTPAQLSALYPTHEDFVAAWDDALASAVAAGFILEPDADELLDAASNSTVPL